MVHSIFVKLNIINHATKLNLTPTIPGYHISWKGVKNCLYSNGKGVT